MKRKYYVCPEMKKLRNELEREGIQWKDASDFGIPFCLSMWICRTHFKYNGYKWSVVHGHGTYGGIYDEDDMGLLECMSDAINNGEPVGFLSADDVLRYMGILHK